MDIDGLRETLGSIHGRAYTVTTPEEFQALIDEWNPIASEAEQYPELLYASCDTEDALGQAEARVYPDPR